MGRLLFDDVAMRRTRVRLVEGEVAGNGAFGDEEAIDCRDMSRGGDGEKKGWRHGDAVHLADFHVVGCRKFELCSLLHCTKGLLLESHF